MNIADLIKSGAVSSSQHGRLHVVRVVIDGQPNEFCSTAGFSQAMLLAERGVKWLPMGVAS